MWRVILFRFHGSAGTVEPSIYRRVKGNDGVWRYCRCHTRPGDTLAEERSCPPYYLRYVDSAGKRGWKRLRAQTLTEAVAETLKIGTVLGARGNVKGSELANAGEGETLETGCRNLKQRQPPRQEKLISIEGQYAMRIEEAAHYIGVSVHFIRHDYRSGQLPYVRTGDHFTFRRSDLEALVDKAVVVEGM